MTAPTAPRHTGTVLALADKLETLCGLFGIGQLPSGDKDPFDKKSKGFSSIFENPQFAGADTSFWIRQDSPTTHSTGKPRAGALSGGGGCNAAMASAKMSRYSMLPKCTNVSMTPRMSPTSPMRFMMNAFLAA